MARSHQAVTLSARVTADISKKLEKLSDATGRSKSFLTAEAIAQYLEVQAWQIASIKKAVKKANGKHAAFVDHKQVVHLTKSWRKGAT